MKGMGFTKNADGSLTSYDYDVPPELEVHGAPEVVITRDADGLTATFDWSGVVTVDRPNTYGIGLGSGARAVRLSLRLIAASRAGKVFPEAYIKTDTDGHTYVAGSATVYGRQLNADLRRLGF